MPFYERRPMPFELQVKLIESVLQKSGIEPDTFDVRQEIDPDNRYYENLASVKAKLRLPKFTENMDLKTVNDLQEKFEAMFKEYIVKTYGEDKWTEYEKNWEEAERRAKFTSIEVLDEKLEYVIERKYKGSKTVGLNNIFENETVKELLNIMSKKFIETRRRDFLILEFGLYKLENALERYSILELLDLKISIDTRFTDPRRKYEQKFSISDNILTGKKNERIFIHICDEHKDRIDQISRKYGLSRSIICLICIIYAFNSYYKNNQSVHKLANAHYYVADDGMILDIIEQLKAFRAVLFIHFRRISRILEKEYDKILLDPDTNKERVADMKSTIEKVKEMLQLNPFIGLHEEPVTKEELDKAEKDYGF